MRIGVNTRLLIAGKMDGIGWFTCETLRIMVAEHPEHEFYFFFDRKPDAQFIFAPNVHPVVLCPPSRHPVLWYLYFEWATPLALRRHKIDLYVSTDGFMPLHAGVPVLDVIHDLNFAHAVGNLKPSHQWFMSYFFPRYARRATRLATVSEYSRSDIAATYGVSAEKIGVVYNGSHCNYRPLSDEEQRQVRQQHTDGAPYFIFVSTIHKRKNLGRLLQAFDRFKDTDRSDMRLLVVGSRQYWKGELEETYNAMRHADKVQFFGHVEPTLLASLLSSAVALVYPSLFEGFGIPILEAFYAETAVITSNVTSMPEVAGEAALLIDPLDVGAIADAMRKVATDNTLRQDLIERGRKQRTLFSWQRTARLLWEEMGKTISLLLLALLLAVPSFAQNSNKAAMRKTPASNNLVYNPSFEDYRECPKRIDPTGQLTIVEGWYQPTAGSADYFNRCGAPTCNVPRNRMGYQQPHSGDAYCGIYCNKTEYREYLQTELREPLRAGCTYRLTFYVSLSEYSTCAITTMGGLLTNERLEDTSRRILGRYETRDIGMGMTQTISSYCSPQVQNPYDKPLDDWRHWQKVEGTFEAKGGERFLTIGNFVPAAKSGITDPDSLTRELTGSYYFIDDVSLTLVGCKSVAEQKPEPDKKEKKQPVQPQQPAPPQPEETFAADKIVEGGTIVLRNIFFEFDKSTLLQQSHNELQRLITLLNKHPKMKILITGHTDNRGDAVYNMRLSQSRARAVVDYLVGKGIAPERLQSKGRGAFEPIDTNATEQGRANNRRVEMKILAL